MPHPHLRPQVTEAEWVGNRRWNLTFKTGQMLALPEGEKESADALVTFARLDGVNRLLGGKVATFDMRAPERIYMRIPGRSEAQVLDAGGGRNNGPDPPHLQGLRRGQYRLVPHLGDDRGHHRDRRMMVLGSGHRAAQGIKRGYVTDMTAATYAVRDAIERAEKLAGTSVSSVWIGCSGAGLSSRIAQVEVEIGGRRIEDDDIEHLLVAARDGLQPDGRMVLHAQPAHYTLDGAHGVANPTRAPCRTAGGRYPRDAGRRRAGAQHHRSGAERASRGRRRWSHRRSQQAMPALARKSANWASR